MAIYLIENWWRHNGIFDRQDASQIPYFGNNVEEYLKKTDEWWESLTDGQKNQIYYEFFNEE